MVKLVWQQSTVDQPISGYPKCHDLVVSYDREVVTYERQL